ncbi:MAG: hypothetical protein H6735_23195 [Alphaproteobacteria bacterium]|nr:hypothetical protein [Alphaproteobacteria bacterium]
MYVGHFAPAFLAKAGFPEVPLWSLFLAAQGLDFVFDGLGAVGLERVVLVPEVRGPLALDLQWLPYSHSLLAAVAWSAVVGLGFGLAGRWKQGALLGAVVLSHWFGDLLVHVHDLHLGLGAEPRLGLGLWNWPLTALIVELALLIGGAAAWWWRGAPGRRLAWLTGALCVAQIGFALGPPLPPVPMVAFLVPVGLSYVAWAAFAGWAERAV